MTPAIRALPPDQRIDWAIHELAGKNPDGTYDYTDVSVRVARAMAKAGHNATQTALRDLRAGTAPPRRWNSLSHSLEVERPAMTVPLMVASAPMSPWSQPASVMASPLGPMTNAPGTAPDPGAPMASRPIDQIVARQAEDLSDVKRMLADVSRKLAAADPSLVSGIEPKRPAKSHRGPGELPQVGAHPASPIPFSDKARADRLRLAGAVEELLRRRGPLSGAIIFRELDDAVKLPFRERQIQGLLRWSNAELGNLVVLRGGRWKLPDQADPVRRRPTEGAVRRWSKFAEAAVDIIRAAGRPLGPPEIWTEASRIEPPGFVRNHSYNVLRQANHPDLVKLPDGSWGLREWGSIVPPRPPGYHSRVRADYYADLAKAVFEILQTEGGPMKSFDIRRRLPAELRDKIEHRQMMDVLFKARQEIPQLAYGEDRLWRIEGMQVEVNADGISRTEQLARAVINILRTRGPMKSHQIRKLLPPDLKAMYPSIRRPLRILQLRGNSQLLELEDRTWALRQDDVDQAA